MKYVLFGAGIEGKNAIKILGKENIAYFVDNDPNKSGTNVDGVPVYTYTEMQQEMANNRVVLSVSNRYVDQIIQQLKTHEGLDFCTLTELQITLNKEKIEKRTDYISIYQRAISWVIRHTIESEGIVNSTGIPTSYPEVTGYYIPTLIHWGYRDLAIQYAKWLCAIQKEDGSWYDTNDSAPYVFDTAQVLKGLLAVRNIYPFVDEHIKKGCDWIIGNVQESGRLTTPDMTAWGTGRSCSELIHLYCLSPLVQAAAILHMDEYQRIAFQVLQYYKTNHCEEIMNFKLLSHFYAYVMEALLDMGETEIVWEAMGKIAALQDENGMVPAYSDVNWVCSTGLFQFSLVWFRLGDMEHGNKAFAYACKLQNESGGWFGSYPTEKSPEGRNTYFPTSEISWAVKYFLDALYYKNVAAFQEEANSFLDKIEKKDGRYQELKKIVHCNQSKKVLDIGCGKGRYLKNFIEEVPQNRYFAVDLSEKVMQTIDGSEVEIKCGSLCNIPYEENFFDIVYTCEALEHAIDIRSAIREMARVTTPGGVIVVIDKNKNALGRLEIGEWEQWFDENDLKEIISIYCDPVQVKGSIPYEDHNEDTLFCLWDGKVKK